MDLDNISEGWIAFWLADGFGFAHPPPPSHPKQIVFKLVTGFPNQGTWGWGQIRTGNGTLGALPLLFRVWVEPDCQRLCGRVEVVWTLALAESGKQWSVGGSWWGNATKLIEPLQYQNVVAYFHRKWVKLSKRRSTFECMHLLSNPYGQMAFNFFVVKMFSNLFFPTERKSPPLPLQFAFGWAMSNFGQDTTREGQELLFCEQNVHNEWYLELKKWYLELDYTFGVPSIRLPMLGLVADTLVWPNVYSLRAH